MPDEMGTKLPPNGVRKQSRHHALYLRLSAIRYSCRSQPALHLDGLDLFQWQIAPAWDNPVLGVDDVRSLCGQSFERQFLLRVVLPERVDGSSPQVPMFAAIVDGYRTPKLAQSLSSHGRRTWILGLAAAGILSILFTLFNGLSASVGAIAIVCIFASTLVTVLTGLKIDSLRGVPLLVFACVCAFVFSYFDWNNNHAVHESTVATRRALFNVSGPQLEFESWYRSRKDLEYYREKRKNTRSSSSRHEAEGSTPQRRRRYF